MTNEELKRGMAFKTKDGFLRIFECFSIYPNSYGEAVGIFTAPQKRNDQYAERQHLSSLTRSAGDDINPNPDHLAATGHLRTPPDQAPVDVEGLKKSEALMGVLLSNGDDEDYGRIKGWNDCVDHLASKGYLRTPPDNSEALEALDKMHKICLENDFYEEGLQEPMETIRNALGDNDE